MATPIDLTERSTRVVFFYFFYQVSRLFSQSIKMQKADQKKMPEKICSLSLVCGRDEFDGDHVCSDHFIKSCGFLPKCVHRLPPSALKDVALADWAPSVNVFSWCAIWVTNISCKEISNAHHTFSVMMHQP